MSTAVIATTHAATRHVVRLVHAASGRVISPVRVAPVAWPTGWWARVVDGTVVVASSSGAPGPAHLDVLIADGELLQLLALPAPAGDQPPGSVRVPLTAAAIDVPVNPVAMTLTIVVSGDPAPHDPLVVKVTAASGGTSVTLARQDTGVYSATQVWGAEFLHADLSVGGHFVRKVSLDYTRAKTSIYVVDPT